MRFFRAMLIAFSMYSQIPIPQFAWKEEDMRYMLCFFPWIGALIGGLVYGWGMLAGYLELGILSKTFIGAAIPLLVTGGFHADGFFDTRDALSSCQTREKKLAILKDPHIGAFAVIHFAVYGLVYLAAFSELRDMDLLFFSCSGFFLSRALSGIAVVTFPSAKEEGLLYSFAKKADERIVLISLIAQTCICVAFCLWRELLLGGIVTAAVLASFFYYYGRTKKEFGGITGDTAGYFVLLCECIVMLSMAVIQVMR